MKNFIPKKIKTKNIVCLKIKKFLLIKKVTKAPYEK